MTPTQPPNADIARTTATSLNAFMTTPNAACGGRDGRRAGSMHDLPQNYAKCPAATVRLRTLGPRIARWLLALDCVIPNAAAGLAHAQDTAAAASALRERHAALGESLAGNQFRKPLVLRSTEAADSATGDIHAIIEAPFEVASAALASATDWCDILMLHINTKGCRAAAGTRGLALSVWIGIKHSQPIAQASRVEFAFGVPARSASYLRVGLDAGDGPMGTRDYRIVLEAIPLDGGRTFIHLTYSYGFDLFGRLAMKTYLATSGRDKVGFTANGLRGVMERNTMRYYLAIEAFLGAVRAPPQARFEKRIRDWYAAAARYPKQLHEIERAEYLEMKRAENLRQPADPA
jgi:hypothetical protein